MLEEDYLSLKEHEGLQGDVPLQQQKTNQIGSQVVREIVLPELEKEVNRDRNFVQLRQVYNSLILATWYKKKIKDSLLEGVYENKNKVSGVNITDPGEKEKIYKRYLEAFKKGSYNFIKEDKMPDCFDSNGGCPTITRKYFSGGETFFRLDRAMIMVTTLPSINSSNDAALSVRLDPAMRSPGFDDWEVQRGDAANSAMISDKTIDDAISQTYRTKSPDTIRSGRFKDVLMLKPEIYEMDFDDIDRLLQFESELKVKLATRENIDWESVNAQRVEFALKFYLMNNLTADIAYDLYHWPLARKLGLKEVLRQYFVENREELFMAGIKSYEDIEKAFDVNKKPYANGNHPANGEVNGWDSVLVKKMEDYGYGSLLHMSPVTDFPIIETLTSAEINFEKLVHQRMVFNDKTVTFELETVYLLGEKRNSTITPICWKILFILMPSLKRSNDF